MKKKSINGEEWRNFDSFCDDYLSEKDYYILGEAQENIEEYRKSDLEITLFDENLRPIPNLEVEINQKSHEFLFGDQLWALDRFHRFNQWNTDRCFYHMELFKRIFNSANALCYWTEAPRNDGPKIEDIQGRNVTEHFEACVNWGLSQNLTVKGHPLFWSIDKCIPEWVKRYSYEKQMQFAELRVRNLVARFANQIKIWDAVNETLWEPVLKNLHKRHWPHIENIEDIADMVSEVLFWCKEENPDAKFLINDYGLEQDPISGAPVTKDGIRVSAEMQRKRYLELFMELKKRGYAPDAVGLQAHLGNGWISISSLKTTLEYLAAVGLPIHITEFWAHIKTSQEQKLSDEMLEKQAEYVKNILTLAFGHPSVEAFFFWGFINDAVIWDDYSGHKLKPVYDTVYDLIKKKWTTNCILTSDDNGVVKLRAFYGNYSLKFNNGNLKKGVEFSVRKSPHRKTQKIVLQIL